ncbi:acetyltransferase, GNAT family [Gottschalkia acidurici 9a]|uniref:Acetyltransferase, GNAT family n=1 Tax=Gottschalkia acidurici (strain ATCC 7906 / DSM 604 / BCRC 14475 / CIP 104303 / KCTC 5404 / NCIMB 10678 / 9a) TaxID=1128398 RepID=K0B3N5_GOTA9|nr:GNAT family N-acetyltransferase [Gottschalkia acidurici]AFS79475.1 acetyltransferase, GNAT family [Gottschalkia acidurici 9a]
MLFRSKKLYVDLVDNKDLYRITEVYNSSKKFLISHTNYDSVRNEWIYEEIESMKKIGFHCCKIVEISSQKLIGIMDFKIDKETYLSLLIIHNDYKNKGFGKEIFHALEIYAKSLRSDSIRIDVVTNYDNYVLDFWTKIGFIKIKDIELKWAGKTLCGDMMKKIL